jgi:hypothetical protein
MDRDEVLDNFQPSLRDYYLNLLFSINESLVLMHSLRARWWEFVYGLKPLHTFLFGWMRKRRFGA